MGAGTLAQEGGTLRLPTTSLPLMPDSTNPILSQTQSPVLDGDNVDDPSVVRDGSGLVMWYAGTAEDGRGPAIFRATSADGKVWARSNGGAPVLEGTPVTFDARGVSGPHVIYNAADALAPYRMYYSGRGDVFGSIGYATSVDGIAWTKRTEGPVLQHGQAGSPDSFAAADPSVLKDGATWKMWYTGDDSTKKRIAYATSPDGITWAKGGKVISPEDPGANANYKFGAFAPSVYKAGGKYRMLLVGRNEVGGGVFQTKVMDADSDDGITWTAPSPSVNSSGTNSKFDYSNLNGPFVVTDPSDAQSPYKLYYSGNTVDTNGNSHTRIGYATSSNGTSFSKVTTGVNADNSVLDIGALGTAFDGRQASGLSVADTGGDPKYVGLYWGTRGSDFKPRLGQATSTDGSQWIKVPGTNDDASLLALGNNAAFDNGGQRDPAVLKDGTDYHAYFTGLSSGGVRTIGYATATAAGLPSATWTKTTTAIVPVGSGFDGTGVAHPSVLKDGTTYHLWYTGYNGATPSIGHMTSASANLGSPSARTAVTPAGSPTLLAYESGGRKDPVVLKDGTTFRMLYTGIDASKVERLLYATSSDGVTWAAQGPVLNPSQQSYAFDEVAVGASGFVYDGATAHVWTTGTDRTGRTRGGHAQSAATATNVPSGWSTHQLGDATTAVRDFRAITRTSAGDEVGLWMSFLQPYSSGSSEYWSNYFPVTVAATTETLNFLLTVRGVRWQARLADTDGATATGNPVLDKVELTHAPVSFAPSGSALSSEIKPPVGQATLAWGNLEVAADTFAPGPTGPVNGTVVVLDGSGATQLASQALTLGQTTTLSLGGIDPAVHKALRVRFDLASGDGAATPLVRSLKLLFNAAATPPPPPPPPPPAPVLTLAASTPVITFGQSVTLTGNLLQSGAPLAARTVSLLAAPATTLGTAVTDAAGRFSFVQSPSANTTYSAASAGVTAPPSASVAVRHAVVLRATRRLTKTGAKVLLRGTLGPAQPGHPIVIERRSGTGWVKFLTTKATPTSTISASKAIKRCGRYTFRAVVPADPSHLDGTSAAAKVELHRIALKVTVRGRRATLTGTVRPAHRSGTVIVRRKVGTRFVTYAKVKVSRRSTFRLVRTLTKGKYSFRADHGTDTCHFAGRSVVRSVTVR